MAVAWIGNREASLAHAVEDAAGLLEASNCPVILLDTDIHGTRAAITLAERIGAAYDLADDGRSAVEAALIMSRGAMTIAPGETRRRADMLIFVGPMPQAQASLIDDLAGSKPDLPASKPRQLFAINASSKRSLPGGALTVGGSRSGLAATLAAIRAVLAGRPVDATVANLQVFVTALMAAVFPVFVYSGEAGEAALEMLQGLVADLNKTKRASTLHLPASEHGWGAVLASSWMTGFAPRTSFARGFPEFDPRRFDVQRMIAAGDADLVVDVGGSPTSRRPVARARIVIAPVSRPVADAGVTIATGAPGVDHDTVRYSARLGTLVAQPATAPSELPTAAAILRLLHERLGAKAVA